MTCRVPIPADPLERRQQWRTWIAMDSPQGESIQRPAVKRSDAAVPARVEWLPEVLSAPPSVVASLRRAVHESLVGEILPIADRERLIRRSMKLGLNRFEANLLIAAVQHRARANGLSAPGLRPTPRRWGLARVFACVLVAEAMVVVGAVRLFL